MILKYADSNVIFGVLIPRIRTRHSHSRRSACCNRNRGTAESCTAISITLRMCNIAVIHRDIISSGRQRVIANRQRCQCTIGSIGCCIGESGRNICQTITCYGMCQGQCAVGFNRNFLFVLTGSAASLIPDQFNAY